MSTTEQLSISKTGEGPGREGDALRARLAEVEGKLAEAQELIRAIHSGEVDAVVVSGPSGDQVFTLRDAEYAYRVLVESMNEGAATLAADGTVLYCNHRLANLLGAPLEQIVGSPVTKLLSSGNAHIFEALLAQARSGEPVTAGLDLELADGKDLPIQLSLREMASVEPVALSMVVTDLTESKARDEIIAAGKLAATILESAAEAIAVCDQTGLVILGNQAFETLCGCNPLFKPFNALLPLQPAGESASPEKFIPISDALAETAIFRQEVVLRRDRRRDVSLLMTASPMLSSDPNGGFVVTMTDITERKLAEAALLRSEKLASVGRMASTIAHEINNPLEAVVNLLYLAMIDPKLPPEAKALLERAGEELDRVTHITQQSLAFHRGTGTEAMVALREVVEGVLKLFAKRLQEKEIVINTQFRANVEIRALGGEIRQVFANLLSNSLDATPSGGRIELRVAQICGKDGSPKARFSIADTGAGIPADRLEKIFEPFFTTKEMVGTGLGLWVSKQILDKHRASIRVNSKPGKGTVFSIVFPLD